MNIPVIDHGAIMNAFVRDLLPPPGISSSEEQNTSQSNVHSLRYDHVNCLVINNHVLSNDEIKEIAESIRDTYCLENSNSGYLVQANNIVGDHTPCQESITEHENVPSTSKASEIDKHNEEFCDVIDCTGSIEQESHIAKLGVREYILYSMNHSSILSEDFLFYDGLKYLGKILKYTHVTLLDLSDNDERCKSAEYLESIRKDIQSSSVNVEINTTECDSFNARVQSREKIKPTTLDLSFDERVRENALDFLAPILQGSSIACLDLSNNNLVKCESLKPLAKCLEGTKVEILNLGCNMLEYDAIKCLALTLKSTQITSIDLCYTAMDDESLRILASCLEDTKINSINLSGNTLSYDAFSCLALALPNTRITSIDLSDTTMNCEGLQVLSSNLADSKIVSLNLSGNIFGIDGISYLADGLKNTQITSIDLSKTNMNCESLNIFSSCLMKTKVSCLFLNGNKLGNEGITLLSRVLERTKITSIDLSGNCIDCEGLKVLASCLSGTKISSLNLSYNKFGYDGIKYLSSCLKDCEITNLNISNNSIECNTLKHFVLHLQDTKLITLDLSGNHICCNTFYLASVLENTRITNLNLSKNKFHSNDPKKIILGMNLCDAFILDLHGKNICSLVFYHLSSALKGTKIISMNLSCIDIDCDSLKYLSQGLRDSSVVSLDLSNNKMNCNDLHYLAQVLRHTKITSLNLSNNRIGFHGLKYLAEGLQGSQIKLLNLSNNPIGDKSFAHLVKNLKCTEKIELDLYGTKISPGTVYELLKNVRIGENFISRISFNDDVPFITVNLFIYPDFNVRIDILLIENGKDFIEANYAFDWTLVNTAYKNSGITKVVYYEACEISSIVPLMAIFIEFVTNVLLLVLIFGLDQLTAVEIKIFINVLNFCNYKVKITSFIINLHN